MTQIEDLLGERIGINTEVCGRALIRDAVGARARALRLNDSRDYSRLLRDSPDEFEQLVETLLVSETWFFRDREPFRALTKLVRREWLPAHPAGRLRLLSVPCSTGEEPYSIALSLLEAEFPATRFEIDAADIRPSAIARARRADYRNHAFRGNEMNFHARYFQATANGWRLHAAVREKVRFEIGNVLDDRFLAQREPYDFIFCRNLLMYLDRPARARVLQSLNHALRDGGVLFVGSAEVLMAAAGGFVPAKLPFSFSCRKAATDPPAARQPRPGDARRKKALTPPSIPPVVSAPTASAIRSPNEWDLRAARRLAGEGRFLEATKICEHHLHERGDSAEAYYLLGRARDTAGSASEACEYYRKALYLEPDHYETLTHWAQLSEKSGDEARARILAGRAERNRK